MTEILQTTDNKYQLIEDGKVRIKDTFVKIEHLNEKSNYYLLYPNESCFLLYHIKNHRFLRNETMARSADAFIRVEEYSHETGSFAAYRSDTAYAHLIYEDGTFEKDTYTFIGPESNDSHRSRPVQLTGRAKRENTTRWIYYHCDERRYGWAKEKAYEYYDGTFLSCRFEKGYFSTYKNGVYWLHFYKPTDISKHSRSIFVHINGYFDLIIDSYGYLVCKLHNKSVYRIYKEDYSTTPIVSFTSKPVLIKGKRMFVCKENCGVLTFFDLDSNIQLENESWDVQSDYEIDDKYLFVKVPGCSTWNIYSRENGTEVYTGWKRISLKREDDTLKLFVGTEDNSEVEIPIDQIENYQLQYLSKLSSLSQQVPSKHTNTLYESETTPTETAVAGPLRLQMEPKTNEAMPSAPSDVDVLPNKIDFITAFAPQNGIRSNNTIHCDRQTKMLHSQDIIFWFNKNNSTIYVSRFTIYKTHKILWRKQLDGDEANLLTDIPRKFFEVHIADVAEQNIIEKISSFCQQSDEIQKFNNDKCEQKKLKELDIRYKNLVNFMIREEYPKEKMEDVVKILLPDWKKPDPPTYCDKVVFKFNDESFSIAPDETWIIKDPFYRHSFLRKADIVAVLLNKNFIEYSSLEGVDYEMEGQGRDPKFDQDFSPVNANSAIKNNDKRILLFKRINNGNVFFDEVECVGYHMAPEYGIGGRKLIIFHLKSKCRKLFNRKSISVP